MHQYKQIVKLNLIIYLQCNFADCGSNKPTQTKTRKLSQIQEQEEAWLPLIEFPSLLSSRDPLDCFPIFISISSIKCL